MSPDELIQAAQPAVSGPDDLYHLREFRTALDPADPHHCLPELHSGEKVLDIGCGAGQTLIAACAYRRPGKGGLCVSCCRNDCPVWGYGVDVDQHALGLGAKWTRRMVLSEGRAEKLPFPDREFDVIISRVALPYTNLPESAREMRRVLKPGGRLWLLLHPFALTLRQAKGLGPKGLLSRLYVAVNGVIFHLTLRPLTVFGRCETWQSESAMRRLLTKSGFTQIEAARRDVSFLITARG